MSKIEQWKIDLLNCLNTPKGSDLQIPYALVIKEKHIPKHLYKFRKFSFDDRETIDRLRSSLQNNEVWLTRPSEYNDPFDSAHFVDFTEIRKETAYANLNEILKVSGLDKTLSGEARDRVRNASDPMKQLLTEVLAITPDKEKLPPVERVHEFFESYFESENLKLVNEASISNQERLKTCSFSQRWNSILMWSHYADEHRGLCIEYPTTWPEVQKNMFKIMLYPVFYQEKLIDFTEIQVEHVKSGDLNNMTALLCAIHKAQEWSYEREWRIVSLIGNAKKGEAFPVPKPTRILVGLKMPEKEKNELKKICEKFRIPFEEIGRSEREFKLTRK